jgi:hypothetical protein
MGNFFRRAMTEGWLGGAVDPYAGLTKIHVATTGSDSAPGDGTLAHPYATVSKALSVAAAGNVILLAAGTYQENTDSYKSLVIKRSFASYVIIDTETHTAGAVTVQGQSGGSYPDLYFSEANSAYIKFRNLIIGGMGAGILQPRYQSDHIAFENCTFNPKSGTNIGITFGGYAVAKTNWSFTNCVINCTGAGASYKPFNATLSGGDSLNGLTLTNCNFYSTGTGGVVLNSVTNVTISGGGVYTSGSAVCNGSLAMTNCTTVSISNFTSQNTGVGNGNNALSTDNSNAAVTITGGTYSSTDTGGSSRGVMIGSNITVSGMTATAANWALGIVTNATGFSFSGCSFTSTGSFALYCDGATGSFTNTTFDNRGAAVTTVNVGPDADSSTYTTTVTFTNCTAWHSTNLAGHAWLFGAGCVAGCVADTCNIPQAYDYGLVIKSNAGVEVKNSTIYSGSTAAVLLKGCDTANVHANTVYGLSGGNAFNIVKNASNTKVTNYTFTHNTVSVSGAGAVMSILPIATDDGGGGVVDYNAYTPGGTGKYGQVHLTTGIQALAAVQAAWAGYGDGSNDSHSTGA